MDKVQINNDSGHHTLYYQRRRTENSVAITIINNLYQMDMWAYQLSTVNRCLVRQVSHTSSASTLEWCVTLLS